VVCKTSGVSIRATLKKTPGSTAAERAQAQVEAPPRLIPDGCNAGTLVRVALAVNGVLIGVAATLADTQALFNWIVLSGAAEVEPVTLLTLICWCLLRRRVPAIAWFQRLVAAATPALLALAWLTLLGSLDPGRKFGHATVVVALAAVLGLLAQHYFELRERAFSPAVAEARFQALQSRIRPHFFFNSLNAVLSVIRDDPLRAERMLENIAELFRAVMADVRKLVPLDQEVELCRRYVEIEQTRLGERLHVEWQVGAVHPKARVPQLLLQPMIENAVRYGAEKMAGKCDVEVRIRQHGFNLEVFISNPIAREPIQREGNQIGLNNIRGRLSLVYDLEARLETQVRRGRFELTLTIPIENKGVT